MKTFTLRGLLLVSMTVHAWGCGEEQAVPSSLSEGVGHGALKPVDAVINMALSRADRAYLLALSASYAYQGQMSNLAIVHTHSPDVRDFGRFVVETSDDVRRHLHLLEAHHNTRLPAILSHKQSYRLHKLSCCVWFFEKSYFKYMYKELASLKSLSRRAAASSANPDVRACARDILDTIDLTIRLSAAGNPWFDGAHEVALDEASLDEAPLDKASGDAEKDPNLKSD